MPPGHPKVPYDKSHEPLSAQLERLKQRGMVVEDDQQAIHYLGHLNYYRLSAYWLGFDADPHEYLNCDLKAGVHSGKPARTKHALKKKVLSHMRMLQKKPKRVAKYFRHEKIAYAA